MIEHLKRVIVGLGWMALSVGLMAFIGVSVWAVEEFFPGGFPVFFTLTGLLGLAYWIGYDSLSEDEGGDE